MTTTESKPFDINVLIVVVGIGIIILVALAFLPALRYDEERRNLEVEKLRQELYLTETKLNTSKLLLQEAEIKAQLKAPG